MSKKSQVQELAIFLGFFIILIIAYLFFAPPNVKTELYSGIYYTTTIPTENNNIFPVVKYEDGLSNIKISKNGIYYVLYSSINLSPYLIDYISYNDLSLKSSFFSSKNIILNFPYNFSKYVKATLSFNTDCPLCHYVITLNKKIIYDSVPNKTFVEIELPKPYLKENNNISIKYLRKSIFSKSIVYLRDIKINLYKPYYLEKYIKIPYSNFSQIYLIYDFCPYSINNINIYINKQKISLSSCNPEKLGLVGEDITEYINSSKVYIKIHSLKDIYLKNIGLLIKNTGFSYTFQRPPEKLIIIDVNSGEGTLYINNCTFPLYSGLLQYNISQCISSDKNMLKIDTNNFIYINKIELK